MTFLRLLLLQLPEALLKTKKKKFENIFEEEKILVIFAKKKKKPNLLCPINDYLLISMINIWYDYNIF